MVPKDKGYEDNSIIYISDTSSFDMTINVIIYSILLNEILLNDENYSKHLILSNMKLCFTPIVTECDAQSIVIDFYMDVKKKGLFIKCIVTVYGEC